MPPLSYLLISYENILTLVVLSFFLTLIVGYSEYYLSGGAAYLGREKQPSERVNSARGLVEFMVLGENGKMANSTTDFICNAKGLF